MKGKIKRNKMNVPIEQTRNRTGGIDNHPQKYYHNIGKKYAQGDFRVVDEIYKHGKISNGNIYWRDIPDGATVYTRGNLYYVDGKMVFWHGREAKEAQGELKRMSMRGKKGDYRIKNWNELGGDAWENPTSEYKTKIFLVGGGTSGYWQVWCSDDPGGSSEISPIFVDSRRRDVAKRMIGYKNWKWGTKKDALDYARDWMKSHPEGD